MDHFGSEVRFSAMKEDSALTIKGFSKFFGEVEALNDVSLPFLTWKFRSREGKLIAGQTCLARAKNGKEITFTESHQTEKRSRIVLIAKLYTTK